MVLKAGFERQSCNQSIYEGATPPYGWFTPPVFFDDFLNYFCSSLGANHRAKKYVFSDPVLYGGFFPDQVLGLKPKDYDIYMSCPDLVRDLSEVLNRVSRSYSDNKDRDEIVEEILGPVFPFLNQRENFGGLRGADLESETVVFAVYGGYSFGDDVYSVDLKISNKPVRPMDIAQHDFPPALSAAMTVVDDVPQFAYHKDFLAQVQEKVFVNDNPHRKFLESLAEKRGFKIVTSEEWAAIKEDLEKTPSKAISPPAAWTLG